MGGWRGLLFFGGVSAFVLGPIALAAHDVPRAGAKQSPAQLRSETRAVQIEVNVTDSHGNPVEGLSESDFTLLDAGKPREIQLFTVANTRNPETETASTPAPIPTQKLPPNIFTNISTRHPASSIHSTVVLIDSYDTSWDDIISARPKVQKFLGELQPGERVAIYDYGTVGLEMVQDFTADHALAAKALDRFTMPPMKPADPTDEPIAVGVMARGPNEVQQRAQVGQMSGMNVFQVMAKHLALVPGRKSMIWVTAGYRESVLHAYRDGWDKVSAILNNADIALDPIDAHFCVYPENCSPSGAAFQSIEGMKTIADWTGGREFDHRADLDAAMLEAIGFSEPTYVLGFYLSQQQSDGKYHPLKVEVHRSGLELRYRQGYYAGPAPEVAGLQRHGDLAESLLNPADSSGVVITAQVTAAPGKSTGTLQLRLNLAPQTIGLKADHDGWTGKIDELFVETNDIGATVGKASDTKEFQVTKENRATFDQGGATLALELPLAQDATELHIVVRDKATGHVGSLTIQLASVVGAAMAK